MAPVAIGILAALLLALAASGRAEAAPAVRAKAAHRERAKTEKRPYYPETARALADKWGPIFKVPQGEIMTIVDVESRFDPTEVNDSPRALKQNGAWGFMQVTGDTGAYLVGLLSRSAYMKTKSVPKTLAKYDPKDPRSLLDPDLNVMLGSFLLGTLRREFSGWTLVSAAYHQGPGKVRHMIALGQAIPARLPPYGQEYVAKAEIVRRRYA